MFKKAKILQALNAKYIYKKKLKISDLKNTGKIVVLFKCFPMIAIFKIFFLFLQTRRINRNNLRFVNIIITTVCPKR